MPLLYINIYYLIYELLIHTYDWFLESLHTKKQ